LKGEGGGRRTFEEQEPRIESRPAPDSRELIRQPEPVEPEIAGTVEPTAGDALHARLGTEGIVRLRGRHAEILARITERIQDPTRREELKSQAERLNPDTWVTEAEVTAGLEQYETIFESVRAQVGRRRRRRRRRGPKAEPGGSTPVQPETEDGASEDVEE
jgi:hypothetical protein